MKKYTKLLLVLASGALLLSGCNNVPGNGNGGSTPSSYTTSKEAESYKIMVKVQDNVIDYTLSKEKAKKGETVTFTITSIADGYSIASVKASANGVTVTDKGNNVYEFIMPDMSLYINVALNVTGDVTLQGDVTCPLTKGEGTLYHGVVSVPNTMSNAYVYYQVGNTKLDSLTLDDSRSFGDIELANKKGYALLLAGGTTYDVYYDADPELSETPCYIQRKSVDVLPNNVNALEDLLICSRTVRSEYSIYTNLNHIDYNVYNYDTTVSDDFFQNNYVWNKYENNVSFATITDTRTMNQDDPMYVYKKYDTENKLVTTVDTYPYKKGSKILNDDSTRYTYNNFGAYSGYFGVMDGYNTDSYGHRYEMNEKEAIKFVNTSAHMPNYWLERDIMYSYRVGFTADEMSSYNIDIKSTKTESGFDTAVNSYIEYNSEAGTYTSAMHEAYTFVVNMKFTTEGKLTHIDYKKTVYTQKDNAWDFSKHTPATGKKGTIVHSITANYGYGDPITGTPNYGDFNIKDYFLTSIDKIQFYNAKTKKDSTDGKSYINLGDSVSLLDLEGKTSSNLIEFDYSPATALDIWEYSPVESTDTEVISKSSSDTYNQMTSTNVGKSTLTFKNHVEGTGITFTHDVEVISTQGIWYFYIRDVNNDSSYASVDTASSAKIKAGGIYKFKLATHRADSPVKYHAVSSDTNIVKVISADNSKDLILDTRDAVLTKTATVTITFQSDFYDTGSSATVMTFYVLPAAANPLGKWKVNDAEFPNTYVEFTDETYNETTGTKKGVLVDEYYDKGEYVGTDKFYFEYLYSNGDLKVKIYDVQIQTIEGSYDEDNFVIDFYYDAETGRYGVFLALAEYDTEEYEWYYSGIILGDYNESGDYYKYTPFEKVVD